MTKYRIVQVEDKYAVQRRVWFWWVYLNKENPLSDYFYVKPKLVRINSLMDTHREAEKAMNIVEYYYSRISKLKNLKVIKEVKL